MRHLVFFLYIIGFAFGCALAVLFIRSLFARDSVEIEYWTVREITDSERTEMRAHPHAYAWRRQGDRHAASQRRLVLGTSGGGFTVLYFNLPHLYPHPYARDGVPKAGLYRLKLHLASGTTTYPTPFVDQGMPTDPLVDFWLHYVGSRQDADLAHGIPGQTRVQVIVPLPLVIIVLWLVTTPPLVRRLRARSGRGFEVQAVEATAAP